MTSYTVAAGGIGAHAKTLVADTVDEVTFDDDVGAIEVVSDGSAELYFTIDGVAPTVGGDDAYYMPAVPSVRRVDVEDVGSHVVRLISPGTPTYSVAQD